MTNNKNDKTVNNKTAAIDFLWVLTTLLCVKWMLLKIPGLWTFAGPIALLTALAVATWRLKLNHESWHSLGLFKIQSKRYLLIWSLIALVVTIGAGIVVGSIVNAIMANPEEAAGMAGENRFANVPGNWPVYLYWLMVSWVIGGFTEEMLFRGFFILRIKKALDKTAYSTAAAIIIQAVIFGQQHYYYQGIRGFFETTIIAMISGLIFIKCKRTLWPLIISHGLANTIGMTLIFTGNT